VTGGRGFIGSNLTRSLLELGARVTVIDNLATGRLEHLPASDSLMVLPADVSEFAGLEKTISAADYVFRQATQVGNVKSMEQTESDAKSNVLGYKPNFKDLRESPTLDSAGCVRFGNVGSARRGCTGDPHAARPHRYRDPLSQAPDSGGDAPADDFDV